MALGTLTLLPPIGGVRDTTGRVLITQKFLSGMELYCRLWPGRVRVVLHPQDRASTDLDHVAVHARDLPFELALCRFDGPELAQHLAGSALVLGGPDYRIPNLVSLCRKLGAPCVFVTEYSLRTRFQIGRIGHDDSIVRRVRHAVWEVNQERLILKELTRAAGVQCNGTPTYSLYRHFSKNPLLYFDTRSDETLFATPAEMAQREARLRGSEPLTLAFSGRLIPMKGAEHLLDVAAALKRRKFPFRMLIAGDGSSAPAMRERIVRDGLSEVQLLGVLPFRTGLVPLMREQVDLFVACHRQGDPSCTYLETLAAGVPIAGYTNEAFAGLLGLAEVGVGAPLDRPERLAELIQRTPREELVRYSHAGLRFAREHAFEATFRRRIAHLIGIAEAWQAERTTSARPKRRGRAADERSKPAARDPSPV
jgi:glycosyltransferase involved in cell wall biosynthesis